MRQKLYPYFVDETKRGGCPVKKGRGAGTALEDLEDKEAGGELGNVGSIWVYISFQKGDY